MDCEVVVTYTPELIRKAVRRFGFRFILTFPISGVDENVRSFLIEKVRAHGGKVR